MLSFPDVCRRLDTHLNFQRAFGLQHPFKRHFEGVHLLLCLFGFLQLCKNRKTICGRNTMRNQNIVVSLGYDPAGNRDAFTHSAAFL